MDIVFENVHQPFDESNLRDRQAAADISGRSIHITEVPIAMNELSNLETDNQLLTNQTEARFRCSEFSAQYNRNGRKDDVLPRRN